MPSSPHLARQKKLDFKYWFIFKVQKPPSNFGSCNMLNQTVTNGYLNSWWPGFLTVHWNGNGISWSMKNHCRGLSPLETKSEIMTFCWRLEKDKAVHIQYLNFQNKKFLDTLFQHQKDVISFHFLSFLPIFQVCFFIPLCVRASGWACLSSFWNFLILKIWFYLPCKKFCYWCTAISLVCSICFCCFLSIHILFSVPCLSLCFPVTVLALCVTSAPAVSYSRVGLCLHFFMS